MEFLADTHVHVYPGHDPGALVAGAVSRLRRAAGRPKAPCALFLTEGRGYHWFQSLKEGGHRLPPDWKVEASPEPEAVWIDTGADRVLVFAGRQLVAAERVEILALTLEPELADGARAADLLADVEGRHAIPVLAWAPGKWMFARAKVVESLVGLGGETLRLGDSSLRCLGWPSPAPMRNPRAPVLAGSDPLPRPGEEKMAGTYGILIDLSFDPGSPVRSFRRALRDPATPVRRVGGRNSPPRMFLRLAKHQIGKTS